MNPLQKCFAVLWSGLLGYVIALVPQGIWTGLLLANLRKGERVPWSVPIMAVVLLMIWMWLAGKGWPKSNSEARRNLLRARPVARGVFVMAILAGVLSLIALCGLWIVMAETVAVPASSLPDFSKYSALMVLSAIGMGAFVGAVLEEAGIRGYCQSILQRHFTGPEAAVISSLWFAIGPHPPSHGFLVPRLVFYFLVGLMLASMTYFADSILPAIVVHTIGLALFFTFIWPHDATRQLIWGRPTDVWFAVHLAQVAVFGALAMLAFNSLARLRSQQAMAAAA